MTTLYSEIRKLEERIKFNDGLIERYKKMQRDYDDRIDYHMQLLKLLKAEHSEKTGER